MIYEKEAQDIVNQRIDSYNYNLNPKGLYEPIRYILSMGGKRMRSVFTLLGCNLFDDDVSPAIDTAVGVEIFHNFTLLHDDIMDKAPMRRGMPTVHQKWNDNTAILSGDAMQIEAYRWMTKTPLHCLKPVLDLFSQTALQVCEGQQYDMDFESRSDVSLQEYINMIRLKTAVLMACSLQIGGWIGGAGDKDAHVLYDCGINLGLAFQLQDDLLDVYGSADLFGKKIGGDILCNKKTFLLILAFDKAQGETLRQLKFCTTTDTYGEQEKITIVRNIYNELNIRELCQIEIMRYYQDALQLIGELSCSQERTKPLRCFVETLMMREA